MIEPVKYSQTPQTFSYQSMGTSWEVSVWDEISSETLTELKDEIVRRSNSFDHTYSRFKKDSFVWEIAGKTGIFEVEREFMEMLEVYKKLYKPSGRKINPLVGYAISDLGYDAEYSLEKKDEIRIVPDLAETVRIVDSTHIEIQQPALFDFGALGKGYFVDQIAIFLKEKGIKRFLVNGSGDIYYEGDGHVLRCGMEHPSDPTQVIGVIEITQGSVCASAINRRAWKGVHHVVDPHTLTSPNEIAAVWTVAQTARLADGLATCLFFVSPEELSSALSNDPFECCIVNSKGQVKKSPGFAGEIFTA
jgi:thiamine biosynthesis lipoprotein